MSAFFNETFHHPLRGGTLKRFGRSAHDEWRPEQPRDLGCPLTGVDYQHATRTATLRLPAHCCVDMGGAIAFVTQRFPPARRIVTVAGDELDTCYRCDEAGGWHVERVGDGW